LALSRDPRAAQALVEHAERAYQTAFAPKFEAGAPASADRAAEALGVLYSAVEAQDGVRFAAGRAALWTAILAGSYAQLEASVQAGDVPAARDWLTVREYRQATRFERLDVDATLAIEQLGGGQLAVEATLQAVRADLWDTYQSRLNDTLRDLADAEAHRYLTREAELAALSEGYFLILAPAYGQQRGAAALDATLATFASLRAQAEAGEPVNAPLSTLSADLATFRAAPLSPSDQAKRAGQLQRYIGLVAVEYGRGVVGAQVTKDFEVQEAISFLHGAATAFNDLRVDLDRLDPVAAAELADRLAQLDTLLADTAARTRVAEPGVVQAEVDAIKATLERVVPAEWRRNSTSGDFDVIGSLLDQMVNAARAGQYELAESARLEAYAIMETGPEARLMAFAPQMKLSLEALFWNGQDTHKGLAYLIRTGAPATEIKATRVALGAQLDEAKALLSQNTAPAAIATNAGLIVFREGLEAVVILASLMSSLKGANQRLRRPLWLGTIAALLATVATWVVFRTILSALAHYGELLEAVVSLIAIGVLLLITNWFFHKVYWTDWIASFHSQKKRLIGGEAGLALGLGALGFTSVYREGFETALFLQALVLDAGAGTVLLGTAVGFAAVLLVGWLVFHVQLRLPQKKMLIVTGILIGGVLLMMVGTTTHVLQVIGWLPIHAIPELPLPYWTGIWFGLYPTLEGLGLQAAAATFVIGSYLLAERMKDHGQRPAAAQARISVSGTHG
jgi:high-affinity iron transporter